jgi:hypothetical protein
VERDAHVERGVFGTNRAMRWCVRRSSVVCSAGACRTISSMPRLPRHEQRLGVVGVVANHPLRFLSRATFGPWRLTSANVASISVTSAGEVLSSRIPSGRPLPSASTIHFVPLPRLVFLTAEPPLLPERSCRPGISPPATAGLRGPALRVADATRQATHPAFPTASTTASRL